MSRVNSRRQKGKGKGGAVSTKFDRELTGVECDGQWEEEEWSSWERSHSGV